MRNFNAQQTYVDKNDPWKGILAAAAFAIHSTTSRQKCYSPGQLIFFRDVILLIKHRLGWELIRQRKHTQNNRDNARENKHRVDYAYKSEIKSCSSTTLHTRYETPYKGPFLIKQFFANGTVLLQCGAIKSTCNIRYIKPYKSDNKVEDFNPKNMDDAVNI